MSRQTTEYVYTYEYIYIYICICYRNKIKQDKPVFLQILHCNYKNKNCDVYIYNKTKQDEPVGVIFVLSLFCDALLRYKLPSKHTT